MYDFWTLCELFITLDILLIGDNSYEY